MQMLMRNNARSIHFDAKMLPTNSESFKRDLFEGCLPTTHAMLHSDVQSHSANDCFQGSLKSASRASSQRHQR